VAGRGGCAGKTGGLRNCEDAGTRGGKLMKLERKKKREEIESSDRGRPKKRKSNCSFGKKKKKRAE